MGLMDKLMGVQESAGGGFSDVEPGAYKLVITKVEPHADRQFVRLYWDVAEGERKGAYAKSEWPPSDVISWKDTALGTLKYKTHRIYECNRQRLHATTDADGAFVGLDEFAQAADGATTFGFLVGCRFGAVVRRRLYTAGPNSKAPGADRTQMEVARYLSPQEFADRDWPESLLDDRDDRDATTRAPQPAQAVVQVPQDFAQQVDGVYDEDVPF